MSGSKHLDAELKIRIQALLAEKSVSEVAAQLGLSRNTVYRWKDRKNICRKSRRPKTGTASLLPVQRDVICELIRLSRWPKRELLPLVSRVFPVFQHVGEAGQRRLWKEVLGTGTLAPVRHDANASFYRSSFRVAAFFVAQEGNGNQLTCLLAAWETASGVLVHRVLEGYASDTTDFLVDLCHEWPFQVEQITIVSTESGVFPGLPGRHLEALEKSANSSISEEFKRSWTKLPPLGEETSERAGPQTVPPMLKFESRSDRTQIILLPPRDSRSSADGVKKTIRSWITSHNTRLRGARSKWLTQSRHVLTPEEYLIRLWESAEMNGAVGDEALPETRAKLHRLLTQPLVMYSKSRRRRVRTVRPTSPAAKK